MNERSTATSGADTVVTRQVDQVFATVPAPPVLRPAGPVVSAASAQLWNDAAAARAAAIAYAARTRGWARAAYRKARAEGFEAGRSDGLLEAAALVACCQAEGERLARDLEAALPAMVLQVIEDVFGAWDQRELAVQAVRHAVARLSDAGQVTLRVHPELAEPMRNALRVMDDPVARSVAVEVDPTLEPLGCQLRSALGDIELGVAVQLSRLREGLGTRGTLAEAAS